MWESSFFVNSFMNLENKEQYFFYTITFGHVNKYVESKGNTLDPVGVVLLSVLTVKRSGSRSFSEACCLPFLYELDRACMCM